MKTGLHPRQCVEIFVREFTCAPLACQYIFSFDDYFVAASYASIVLKSACAEVGLPRQHFLPLTCLANGLSRSICIEIWMHLFFEVGTGVQLFQCSFDLRTKCLEPSKKLHRLRA